jgi:hypothetical protein
MAAQRWIFNALSLIVLAFLSHTAWGCTCASQSVKDAKKSADVVFAGRVISVTYVDSEKEWEPRVVAEFAVERVWKGPVTKTFVMHTNFESSSCAGFFREVLVVGEDLLVYGYEQIAKQWRSNGIMGAANAGSFTVMGRSVTPVRDDLLAAISDEQLIYTSDICTRSAPLKDASKDIKPLGKPIAPRE